MLVLRGEAAVQRYIVAEVQTIYAAQGQSISEKHIEVIIRQMFSRVQIEESGDSLFVTGDIVSRQAVIEENEQRLPTVSVPRPLPSSCSRSPTYRPAPTLVPLRCQLPGHHAVHDRGAIRGKTDKLRGLKENVIIGRLIPVGTGFNAADPQNLQPNSAPETEFASAVDEVA